MFTAIEMALYDLSATGLPSTSYSGCIPSQSALYVLPPASKPSHGLEAGCSRGFPTIYIKVARR
jgi:hypothetical protein